MWLSKVLSKNTEEEKAQEGVVTMGAETEIEAASSVNERGINVYLPYGYFSAVPNNQEAFLVPSSTGQAMVGVKSEKHNINNGEVIISSHGGAKIHLKNDGSVVINGAFIINKDGEIIND